MLALASSRNFTRAASACNLSQPAFSALIRQLEESLGVRLFDRTTRQVELTAEGEEFERAAQLLLAEFDSAWANLRQRAAQQRGRVAIALLPSLAADWLPTVLAGYHAEYPGIELQVADVLSESCLERVRTGRADFAFAATRVDTPELRAETFCSDRFHLVCKADHPLAAVIRPRVKDVAAWPFIHLSRTSSVRQYVDLAMHPQALAAVLEVDQLATVSGMVAAGLGVSIVPTLSLYQFRSPALAVRPLDWPGLTRQIYLVRRRDRALSVAAQGLYEWVMARRPPDEAASGKRRKAEPTTRRRT